MPTKMKSVKHRDDPLTLEGEKAAIVGLLQQGEDNHWQIGTHYNNVVDRGLATAAGYKTAVEFFAKELRQIPQSTLSHYGAVAKVFTEAVAKKYGCTKLDLLLTYQSDVHAPATSGDPGAYPVRLAAKDGSALEKKFQDCTSTDLNQAIKFAKGAPALPPDARVKVAKLQTALDSALGAGKLVLKARQSGHKAVVELSAFDVDLASTADDALKAGAAQF